MRWSRGLTGKDEIFPKLMATAGILVGVLVQIGWAFNLPGLQAMFLGDVGMNPLTGVAFIFGGISLLLHLTRERKFSNLFGLLIAFVGLSCLLRSVFWDLKLDLFLFSGSLGSNRMAPNTSFAFVFMGLALASQDLPIWRGVRVADGLSLVSLVSGMVAVTGYIYGVGSLYGIKGFIPMAFTTGLMFVCVSLGILFTRAKEGLGEILLRKDFGGRIARGLLPSVILVPIFLGWLELKGIRSEIFLPEVGAALVSVTLMLILTLLVGWVARSLSRTQAMYHKNSQILESVMQAMTDAVIVVDFDGRYLLRNPAALRIFRQSGLTDGSTHLNEGRLFLADKTTPLQIDKFPLSLAIQGIETTDMELYLTGGGKEGLLVSVDGRPLTDENHQSLGGIAVIRDITERKRQEIVLRDANSELEQKVSERIMELKSAQEQVQQLQKMDAVGRLAGGVAHDFNNLLAAVNMYCDLLNDEAENPAAIRENLQEMRAVAQRGAALTRQLLVFSRKQVVQYQSINLKDLTSQLKKMLERLIPANVSIRTQFSEMVPSIKADPGQLEQVIMNLVLNARDAMPNGGVVTIGIEDIVLDREFSSTHLSVTPGRHAVLTVTDTGLGMDHVTKSRLFEPFFTTKAIGKGTGLGLATVYGIIKQLNGSIWVYSEIGAGSIFKVYFPAEEQSGITEPTPIATTIQRKSGSGKILLVEDEDKLQKLFAGALKKNGYDVIVARNGIEALDAYRKINGGIDLLLTDVVMPEMGGFELVEKMREIMPGVKVLFMSGYANDAFTEKTSLFDDNIPFIQKPFDTTSLISKVIEVICGTAVPAKKQRTAEG